MIWRSVLVLTAVLAQLLLVPAPAAACTCAYLPKAARAQHAMVVFTGSVAGVEVHRTSPQLMSSLDPVEVQFVVDGVFKGAGTKELVVWTNAGDASCGYEFTAGRRYTVFAYEHEGRLATRTCSGTTEGDITPDLYGLPLGRPPDEPRSVRSFLVLAIVATGALVIAAFRVFRPTAGRTPSAA